MSVVDDKLIRQLRNKGVKVRTVKGWRSRGVAGTFKPKGVLVHHTGSAKGSGASPALGIVTHGRSDLDGPLSQIHLSRTAVVTIVAAGRANHAGLGGPHEGIPKDSGNPYLVGIEAENNGIGEDWSPKMIKVYAITCALLLRKMRRTNRMCFGHKEWTSRKIDPANVNMNKFRERIRSFRRRWSS